MLTMLLFAASGMVGQGVLRECLLHDRVGEVRAVVRRPLQNAHPKLRLIATDDLTHPDDLVGVDVTSGSAGPSSNGMREPEYRRQTFELPLGIARAVAAASPGSAFVYVSGAGTRRGSRMTWARVKAETEDAVAALPLRTWMFRPGLIRPLHGIRPASRLYRVADVALRPVYLLVERIAPDQMTTTERIGRAALAVATGHASPGVVTTAGINALARTPGAQHSGR
ncbi:MAG: hypothetical protein WCA30_15015 [Dermatophilaceae bacterium]